MQKLEMSTEFNICLGGKIGELSRKILSGKLFIVYFTFGIMQFHTSFI